MIEKDFSYEFYRNTLSELKKNHKFVGFESVSTNDVILRHDVDIALQPAVKIGKIENELGIQSTYFILIHSPFYNPFSLNSSKCINELLSLGHKIGLHYDSSFYLENNLEPDYIIKKEIEMFSLYFKTSVNVVASHNPTTNKKMDISFPDDIIDADSLKFKENRKYLSDSVQNWREGPFSNFIGYENLYILIHPIWWSDDNKSRVEILQSLEGGDLDYYKKEIEYLKNLQNDYLNKIKSKN